MTNVGFSVYQYEHLEDELTIHNAKTYEALFGGEFQGEAQCCLPDFKTDGTHFFLSLNKADDIADISQVEHVF